MTVRRLLLSSTALATIALCAATSAGATDYFSATAPMGSSLPAVSAVNGKFDFRGGSEFGASAFYGTGSFSVPLGHSMGFQVDGMLGSLGGSATGGIGAHLFWRDPGKGLLGIYGDYANANLNSSIGVSRLAVEGEAYLGRFTAAALLGSQWGASADGFFDKLTLSYYPTDNLKLYAGHRYTPVRGNWAALGGEFLATSGGGHGLSFFGEGRIGERSSSILGGVRVYIGPDKSLIDRHRQDDPPDHFDLYLSCAALLATLPDLEGGCGLPAVPIEG